MSALDQITSGINTDTPDTDTPLGSIASGFAILSKALSSFPELAESAEMAAVIGGDEAGGGQKYNGTVDVMGTPVEFKDGVGDLEGENMYASPSGDMVADENGQILGRIENGTFVVIDQDQATRMQQSGGAERSKK